MITFVLLYPMVFHMPFLWDSKIKKWEIR